MTPHLMMRRFVIVMMRRRMRRRLCVSCNKLVCLLYWWNSYHWEIYTKELCVNILLIWYYLILYSSGGIITLSLIYMWIVNLKHVHSKYTLVSQFIHLLDRGNKWLIYNYSYYMSALFWVFWFSETQQARKNRTLYSPSRAFEVNITFNFFNIGLKRN